MTRMESDLSFNIWNDGVVLRIEVIGRMTGKAVDLLRRTMLMSDHSGCGQIDLILRRVTHSDSTALGLLVGLHKHLLESKRQLRLVSPSDSMARLLRMTHLDQVLMVVKDASAPLPASRGEQITLLSHYEDIQAIFSKLGSGLMALDADGRILLANQSCEDLLGYLEHQMQGKWLSALFFREDEGRAWQRVIGRLSRAEANRARLLGEDGSPIELVLTTLPMRDETKRTIGFMVGLSPEAESESHLPGELPEADDPPVPNGGDIEPNRAAHHLDDWLALHDALSEEGPEALAAGMKAFASWVRRDIAKPAGNGNNKRCDLGEIVRETVHNLRLFNSELKVEITSTIDPANVAAGLDEAGNAIELTFEAVCRGEDDYCELLVSLKRANLVKAQLAEAASPLELLRPSGEMILLTIVADCQADIATAWRGWPAAAAEGCQPIANLEAAFEAVRAMNGWLEIAGDPAHPGALKVWLPTAK